MIHLSILCVYPAPMDIVCNHTLPSPHSNVLVYVSSSSDGKESKVTRRFGKMHQPVEA